jgi:hypothetical protein
MPLDFNDAQIQELFGNEAAENEDPARLRAYYFKNDIYEQVHADLPLRVLVGHKGIGKSALLRVSSHENETNGMLCILIRPDDVAGVAEDSEQLLMLIREWKEGLLRLVASKVLQSFGQDDSGLTSKVKGLSGKLLDLLQETLRNIQRVDLTSARAALLERFLEQKQVAVYVDDLDRGWQGKRQDILRVSALLNAVRDLTADNQGLRFKIALRSDVYFLARTADESTDKIEGSVIWHRWTNHQIFVLLVKRVETFFGRQVDEQQLLKVNQFQLATYLYPIMEERFTGQGKWENAPIHRVLMSLIRRRPRDLVKLLTLASRVTRQNKHKKISTTDLRSVFEEYSQGRIQDTVNEYRSELPEIERLLLSMRPSKKERTARLGYNYATDALLKKLQEVSSQGTYLAANGRRMMPKDLAAFLYKINFVIARREEGGEIQRRYFEENRYLQSSFVDFGFEWEIHPAFRWALQPESLDEIFQKLALSSED